MNNLIKTTELTKSIILDELTKIILDHNIIIEQEKLKQKINLLFQDCKDMTAEHFVSNCEKIRKSELFGKLPANFRFLEGLNSDSKINQLNKIAGFEAFKSIEQTEDSVSLYAIDTLKVSALAENVKDKIKDQFINKKIILR
ncbi:MAG: hypothetical protein FJ368_04115 [Pelagibacterales bacterium]|nr:hypothetical protein [Pelagibacterales bacterium]